MIMQRGISLLEMMVALVSSSLIMLVLTNQYVGVKRHYAYFEKKLEQSLDRLLVSDLIRDSARKAGFTPCLGIDHLASIDTRNGHQGLAAIEIQSAPNPGFISNHMHEKFGVLITQRSPSQLIVTKSTLHSEKKPVIIADCYHAEVHTVSVVKNRSQHQEVRLVKPLMFDYIPPIYIGEWLEERFYVRKEKTTLFYQLGHTDAISNAVHGLTVSLKTINSKRLLQVMLALDKDQIIKLDALVRNA